MPIVVARTGQTQPVVVGISKEQRAAAWAHITKVWAEKHPELLRSMEGESSHGENTDKISADYDEKKRA